MNSEEQHGSQWSSGLFDVCALGAGACMYTFLCEACAYADLSVEFKGGDAMTWWVTYFFAFPCACCSFPCHYLCIHPELRRLIAIKHGKNVKCRSARNRWTCCSLEAAVLDDTPCRKTIRVTPCARPRALCDHTREEADGLSSFKTPWSSSGDLPALDFPFFPQLFQCPSLYSSQTL